MTTNLEKCVIIYGFLQPSTRGLQQLVEISEQTEAPIILVEPRKEILELFRTLQVPKSVKVVARILGTDIRESILYHYHRKLNQSTNVSGESLCFTTQPSTLSTNLIKRETVYSTTIDSLVKDNKIQTIDKLVFNIWVDNLSEIINSTIQHSLIINQIHINKLIPFVLPEFLNNSFEQIRPEREVVNETNYTVYSHKHARVLHLNPPKICIVLIGKLPIHAQDTFNNTISQYNIKTVLYLPCEKGKLLHQQIISTLDIVFDDKDAQNAEIFILVNAKYFNNHSFVKIMYPIQNNVLYVDKVSDTFYASKSSLRILHQIVKSSYFTSYFDDNPKLLSYLARKYFYDYFAKIFTIKDYTSTHSI